MRVILSFIVALGFAMIGYGIFQHASEVARWSQIYGIMDEAGNDNPLRNEKTRDRFDALYFREAHFAVAPAFIGGFTSLLAVVALFLDGRYRTRNKKCQQDDGANDPQRGCFRGGWS